MLMAMSPNRGPISEAAGRSLPDRDVLDDAAEVFQLLSAPGRLQLLWVLSNDEVDVTTLVSAVGGSKAGVSQHLAKLRLAGWLDARRDGRRVRYRVADPHIVTLVHQAVEHVLDLRAGPALASAPQSPDRD
jgi:DNA-binding transcriptional ArsR family regulator